MRKKRNWVYAVLILILLIGAIYLFYPFSTTIVCPEGQTAITSCTQCGNNGYAPGPISSCENSGSASCNPIFEGQDCKVVIIEGNGNPFEFTATSGTWYCSDNPTGYYKIDVYLLRCNECCIGPTTTTTTVSPTTTIGPTTTTICSNWGILTSSCSNSGTASCPSGQQCKVKIINNDGSPLEFITTGYKYWECTTNPAGYQSVKVYLCGSPTTTTIGSCTEGLKSSCSDSGTASCNQAKCFVSIYGRDGSVTEFDTTGYKYWDCTDNPQGYESVNVWGVCNGLPCIKTDETGCGWFNPCCNPKAECQGLFLGLFGEGTCFVETGDCTKDKIKEVKYAAGFQWEDYNRDLECCLSLDGTWYDVWDIVYGQTADEKLANQDSCDEIGYYIVGEGYHTCNFDTIKNYAYCSFFIIDGIEDWVLWALVIGLIILFMIIMAKRR